MVADMAADIEVHMLADMEVDNVAMLANKVAEMFLNEVYWAEVVWCKLYPNRVSSRLCEFICKVFWLSPVVLHGSKHCKNTL